jgi:hypothetical protein
MDPNDAFSAPHPFRWDLGPPAHAAAPPSPFPLAPSRELEDLVAGYGVRPSTVARISELGFTASTLLGRTERELDDTMAAFNSRPAAPPWTPRRRKVLRVLHVIHRVPFVFA